MNSDLDDPADEEAPDPLAEQHQDQLQAVRVVTAAKLVHHQGLLGPLQDVLGHLSQWSALPHLPVEHVVLDIVGSDYVLAEVLVVDNKQKLKGALNTS